MSSDSSENQFALPMLGYLMWTQQWPVDLPLIDKEASKTVIENGGRHPCRSNAIFYLPREKRGRPKFGSDVKKPQRVLLNSIVMKTQP